VPKQEEDSPKGLEIVVELMPHSYREQSERLSTYPAGNEHLKIDCTRKEVLIHGKSYRKELYLIANRNRLESFYIHFLKVIKFFNTFYWEINIF